ncbi:MAG: glutamine amidotransferase-related protein, partial [Nitrososphaerales archaeon]
YGSQRFPAIIESGNVFGTQFHPEKSSKTGFRLIRNFTQKVLTYSK